MNLIIQDWHFHILFSKIEKYEYMLHDIHFFDSKNYIIMELCISTQIKEKSYKSKYLESFYALISLIQSHNHRFIKNPIIKKKNYREKIP